MERNSDSRQQQPMEALRQLAHQLQLQRAPPPQVEPAAASTTVSMARDPALSLLLPLLILLSTLLFLLVFFLIFIIVLKRRRGRGIALTDNDGPIDLAREEELEGEGGLAGIEERWLEQQDDAPQAGYERAKCTPSSSSPSPTRFKAVN